jgi:cytochrome c oxidase assembly factor CtaG
MRVLVGVSAALLGALLFPAFVLAHGVATAPPSDFLALLGLWDFDPTIQIPLIAIAVVYVAAVRQVNRAHPANRVPLRRTVSFLLGLGAIELALQSPIEVYDTTLFSDHMLQHILLTLIASPLVAGGAPITLLLRYSQPAFRRRWILPVLHSRVVRAVTFPVVTWIVFAGVMWGTHFSPIFNESLVNPTLHQLEHIAYLTAGLLFWWPIVGVDPSPWRMPYPVRALYAFLQMPQNTFLALAILTAPAPLYSNYATLQLAWAPTALADQQLAGGLMWVLGDVVFLVAIMVVIAQWMRQEDRDVARTDARLDQEMAEIARREVLLRDRLARERREN